MKSINFLTLDELGKLKDIPCMILLYCKQKYDRQKKDSICDLFVTSQCRWFTAVGMDSALWEDALDNADIRKNPDNDECWAVTASDDELNVDTIQEFLDAMIDNPTMTGVVYVVGDSCETLRSLIQVMLTNYKSYESLNGWIWFPEIMWGLGYEMDCDQSFEAYKADCNLHIVKANTEREQRRNNLYVLEHAERQIVGNHLFSEWRYYTHWNMAPVNEYDIDYLHRVIDILIAKL